MSDLDNIINVSISRNTTTPTQAGFGTSLLLTGDPQLNPISGKEWGTTRVRTYTSLAGVAEDFATTTNTYLMAQALFSQNPRPTTIKVGRRSTFTAQVVTIVPQTFAENDAWGFTLNGTAYSLKNPGSQTDVEDAIDAFLTANKATIEAAADVTIVKVGVGSAATLTVTADVAGNVFRFAKPLNVTLEDTTAGTSKTDIVTDLNAVRTEDDDWYCLLIDSYSADEIEGASDAIEALNRLMVARTFDTTVKSVADASDSTSIAAVLKASNNDRTALFFTESGDFLDCAWAGNVLPENPGTISWAFRTLSGVSVDSFSATEFTNLETKNVNTNTALAGVNVTRYGTASGGEFMDVQRGADWLQARIQERLFTLLVNNGKVPYTDAGIQAIRGEILSQMQTGVARGFLAASPEPTCTVPLASAVSAANKGNRLLTDVTFRATLAGAIHKTTIAGELNL